MASGFALTWGKCPLLLDPSPFIDPKVYKGMGTSTSPAVFEKWAGWKAYLSKAVEVPAYKAVYSGQRSVSPFSSTIISTATFTTPAGTTCVNRCKANALCGAVEIFVERVPSREINSAVPNPTPAYQVVCRLHSKALAAADATFTSRKDFQFVRTQTAVTFLNKVCRSGQLLRGPSLT